MAHVMLVVIRLRLANGHCSHHALIIPFHGPSGSTISQSWGDSSVTIVCQDWIDSIDWRAAMAANLVFFFFFTCFPLHSFFSSCLFFFLLFCAPLIYFIFSCKNPFLADCYFDLEFSPNLLVADCLLSVCSPWRRE